MNTAQLEQLISGYIDDELSRSERERAEALLQNDPRAAKIKSDYLAIRNLFLKRKAVVLPRGFSRSVMNEIKRLPSPRRKSSLWSVPKRLSNVRVWAFPVAAVSIALFLTFFTQRAPKIGLPELAQNIIPAQSEMKPPVWIAPPPMPGIITVTEQLSPQEMQQKSLDLLIVKGADFRCRQNVNSTVSFGSVSFENRLLILLSERKIHWQKSTLAESAHSVYEISASVEVLLPLLQDVSELAKALNWELEPPVEFLHPSLESILNKTENQIKIRFVFEN